MRRIVDLLIGGVLLLLALGLYCVIVAVPDAKPFGYGASGFGLVALAGGLGVLVVLLLRLLIAWRRLNARAESEGPVAPAYPGLRRAGLLLLICGWAGTFLMSIGILRGWDWTVMLIGAVLLAFAGLATYQLAHPHIPAS
jgi:ABC-type xylose transport system permease subunit